MDQDHFQSPVEVDRNWTETAPNVDVPVPTEDPHSMPVWKASSIQLILRSSTVPAVEMDRFESSVKALFQSRRASGLPMHLIGLWQDVETMRAQSPDMATCCVYIKTSDGIERTLEQAVAHQLDKIQQHRALLSQTLGNRYSSENISKLFTYRVASDTTVSCSVCLEEVKMGETATVLPCLHSFHLSCIVPWLQTHSTCCNCRRSVRD